MAWPATQSFQARSDFSGQDIEDPYAYDQILSSAGPSTAVVQLRPKATPYDRPLESPEEATSLGVLQYNDVVAKARRHSQATAFSEGRPYYYKQLAKEDKQRILQIVQDCFSIAKVNAATMGLNPSMFPLIITVTALNADSICLFSVSHRPWCKV